MGSFTPGPLSKEELNRIGLGGSEGASTQPTVEARTAATGRDTGGTSAPSSTPAAPRKGRRGRTLASLDSSVNKPSILGG